MYTEQKNCFQIWRLVLLAGVFAAHLVSADGPPPVPLAPGVLLNSYSFNDTNLLSGKGDAPRVAYNVDLVPSWQSNAVNIAGATAMLAYNETEADGHTNIVCENGSIFFWFAPNWSS